MTVLEVAGSFTKQFFEQLVLHSTSLTTQYAAHSSLICIGPTREPEIYMGDACAHAIINTLMASTEKIKGVRVNFVTGTEISNGLEIVAYFEVLEVERNKKYILDTIIESFAEQAYYIRAQTLIFDGIVELSLPPHVSPSRARNMPVVEQRAAASVGSSTDSAPDAPPAAAVQNSPAENVAPMATEQVEAAVVAVNNARPKPSSWAQVTRMSAKCPVAARHAPIQITAEVPRVSGARRAAEHTRPAATSSTNPPGPASTSSPKETTGDLLRCHLNVETTADAILQALGVWANEVSDLRYVKERNMVFINFNRAGILPELQKANITLDDHRLMFKPARPRETRA